MFLYYACLVELKIKFTRCAGWDAYMRGGFAIMTHMPAPLI
ncbi:hypothetical protein AOR13_1629 [Alteromonas stellipolaris LMG 21856]|nr:hypothetical protein AOR13_1629 [Alteromonas stellipolaris LMG 21856]